MARIICKYSGVVFNCEHMPLALSSNEYYHPLFSIPKKKLLGLTAAWSANKLTSTESYLLYLSLLNSTDLLVWNSPARFTDKTMQIISNNMESLVQMIGKIDLITHPSFSLPRISVNYDTGDMSTSFYWIQLWLSKYNEFMDDYITSQKREVIKEKVERRENSLEKLIKSAFANPQSRANNLADWAALSGNFPDWNTQHPLLKQPVPISDYWQEIIRACVNDESIWRFPKADIEELITHCEDEIPHGSIYAAALMSLLRSGLSKHTNFTGFGDVDLAGKTTTFKLLSADSTAEDANIRAAIQSAPETEPKRHQYPTVGAYLRAKLNYDLAQKHKRENGGS